MNPNHYTGDVYSFEKLSELREESVARSAARRQALGPAPKGPGVRAIATILRRSADRLAPLERETPEYPPASHLLGGI
jgi:hypothetical protein